MPIYKRENSKNPSHGGEYQPSAETRLNLSETPSNRRLTAFKTYALPGVKPAEIPIDDLVTVLRTPQNDENVDYVYRNRIKGRLSAIRAFCVFCQGGSPKAARLCAQVTCPLWSFRTGANGMRGERK